MINSWEEVMREQIQSMSETGLLDATEKFTITIMEENGRWHTFCDIGERLFVKFSPSLLSFISDVFNDQTPITGVFDILNEFIPDERKIAVLEYSNDIGIDFYFLKIITQLLIPNGR